MNHSEARLLKSILTGCFIKHVLNRKFRFHALYDGRFTLYISYTEAMYIIVHYSICMQGTHWLK